MVVFLGGGQQPRHPRVHKQCIQRQGFQPKRKWMESGVGSEASPCGRLKGWQSLEAVAPATPHNRENYILASLQPADENDVTSEAAGNK